MIRAVFLDRDGVINKKAPEGNYIKHWKEFEFLPGAVEAIRTLNELDFKVFVVTNQRGIAKGLMDEVGLKEIHKRMLAELGKAGAAVDGIYYCPHDKGSCQCRKPAIGLFLEARKQFPEISFPDSVVIGDSLSDMEAGKKVSSKCILITSAEGMCAGKWYHSARTLRDAVNRYLLPICVGR